jgi:DNA invertase Pin-like site-specific DNA recombinase
MKCAVYLRISEDRTGERLAVERQRTDCLKLCEQRRWQPVEYVDNDTSASTGKRPEYERMLADIRAGSVGAVAVWDLDRLHRRPIELEHFMELADEKRLALATVTGEVDLSTDNGRLFARIKGAVARSEVERKVARQKRQAKQAAESGKGWGGRRAFGYVQGSNNIRADEAKLIKAAYKAVSSGASLYSVAAQWNKAGVSTTVGNQWSGSTVRQVLVNPRYMGKRTYKGEIVADALWQPIVSADLWQSVHAVLTNETRNTGRTPGRKYLLTGILCCGRCGETMGSGVANDDGAAVYTCKHCLRNSRRQAPVDKLVVDLVVGFLSRPDAVGVLIDGSRNDIGELREQERVLLDRSDAFTADYADGNLNAKQLRAATERVEAQLVDVRSQMVDADRSRVFDGLVGAKDVRKWWRGLSLDRKRAIVSTVVRPTLQPAGRGRPFHRDHLTVEWLTGND